MNICTICQGKTISEPYDKSLPIVCEKCKRKCTVCGKPVAVVGHSKICEKCRAVHQVYERPKRIKIICNL